MTLPPAVTLFGNVLDLTPLNDYLGDSGDGPDSEFRLYVKRGLTKSHVGEWWAGASMKDDRAGLEGPWAATPEAACLAAEDALRRLTGASK